MSSVIVLLSGGLDSTVLLSYYLDAGWDVTAMTFRYPSIHNQMERWATNRIVGWHWDNIGKFVPEHVEVKVSKTWFAGAKSDLLIQPGATEPIRMLIPQNNRAIVPGRNLLFIAMANVFAASRDIQGVAIGTNANDAWNNLFPDCTPNFLNDLGSAMMAGYSIDLLHPFSEWKKWEIVQRGAILKAPMEYSWSCYEGGPRHCGICPACRERKAAFDVAGVKDETVYASDI
jgi:7-cyano-7-deazaguanine synthase